MAEVSSVPLWAAVRRAKSTCDACGLCTAVCDALEPHLVVRAIAHGVALDNVAAAARCHQCGNCDQRCPLGLEPSRIIAEVARRLEAVA